jgi:hypothetical protein
MFCLGGWGVLIGIFFIEWKGGFHWWCSKVLLWNEFLFGDHFWIVEKIGAWIFWVDGFFDVGVF